MVSWEIPEEEVVPDSLGSEGIANISNFSPTAARRESTLRLISAADLATSSFICSVD